MTRFSKTPGTSNGKAEFLGRLFAGMNQVGASWAVMRNHEHLPATTAGSDLDLITGEACRAKMSLVVDKAVGDCRAVIVGKSRSLNFEKIFVLGRVDGAGYWGLCIDLNFGLAYRGKRLLLGDVSSAITIVRGIAVLREDIAAVLGVLKEILSNAVMPQRYLQQAKAAAQTDWHRVASLLSPMGTTALRELQHSLLHGTPGNCVELSTRLRRAIAWEGLRTDGLVYVWRRIQFETSKLSRFLAPPGAVIAILGVDGVGKSTVIQSILPALNEATHGACRVRHLRPGLLPPLARLKRRGPGESHGKGPTLDPHGSSPSGWAGSILRICWALADYMLGYWIETRPYIAKQPGIVLFDRYVYDMYIDPRRFRIGLAPSVTGWLALLAPRPDLIICLHADVEVILARKQELPRGEVERQLAALRSFAASRPNAVLISAEGEPQAVRGRVLEILMEHFERRDQERHGYSAARH